MTDWRIIVGPPGTGKTATLLGVLRDEIRRGVHPSRIAFLTFTRAARLEMLSRVTAELGLNEDDMPWLRTVHSTAYRLLRIPPETLMLNDRWAEFAKLYGYELSDISVADESEKFDTPSRTKHDGLRWVISWGRCRRLDAREAHSQSRAWVNGIQLALFAERLEQFKTDHGLLDFSDMVERVIELGLGPQVDVVLIDEAQDLSPLEIAAIEIWTSGAERVYVAGDPDQCHPPGVLIQKDRAQVPIESLRDGDRIDAWMRSAQEVYRGREIRIASRPYTGPILDIRADSKTVPVTPNHRLVARFLPEAKKAIVTYLMWRAGFGYRVGWCKLFSEGVNPYFHLGLRARIEKADAIWILRVFTNRTKASAYESIVAARYGLPTVTFEPVKVATHLTEATIKEIFDALQPQNDERGRSCLEDHGRRADLPFYPWPDHAGARHRKSTVFQVYATNALPTLMAVPVPQGRNRWATIDQIQTRNYDGPVYSLDVERDHSYVANGLVVLNSIYNFKGATPDWMVQLEATSTSTYLGQSHRVPTLAHRIAKRIITHNRNRLDSEYRPAGREGELRSRIPITKALDDLDERGAFVLARNRFFLRAASKHLFAAAKPYVVEGGRGGPNPLGMPRIVRAVRTALSIHKGVTRIDHDDVEALLSWVPAGSGLVGPGSRAMVRKMKGILDVPAVAILSGFDPLLKALAIHPTNPITGLPAHYRTYFQKLIDRHGEIPAPKIRLMTMHASKGREHDHVVVLSDHTSAVDLDCRRGDWEAENRIRYVAVTRTKEKLTLCSPEGRKFYQYPTA